MGSRSHAASPKTNPDPAGDPTAPAVPAIARPPPARPSAPGCSPPPQQGTPTLFTARWHWDAGSSFPPARLSPARHGGVAHRVPRRVGARRAPPARSHRLATALNARHRAGFKLHVCVSNPPPKTPPSTSWRAARRRRRRPGIVLPAGCAHRWASGTAARWLSRRGTGGTWGRCSHPGLRTANAHHWSGWRGVGAAPGSSSPTAGPWGRVPRHRGCPAGRRATGATAHPVPRSQTAPPALWTQPERRAPGRRHSSQREKEKAAFSS